MAKVEVRNEAMNTTFDKQITMCVVIETILMALCLMMASASVRDQRILIPRGFPGGLTKSSFVKPRALFESELPCEPFCRDEASSLEELQDLSHRVVAIVQS